MERWLSWSKAHDWKSCNVSKAFWGSNPPDLSPKRPELKSCRVALCETERMKPNRHAPDAPSPRPPHNPNMWKVWPGGVPCRPKTAPPWPWPAPPCCCPAAATLSPPLPLRAGAHPRLRRSPIPCGMPLSQSCSMLQQGRPILTVLRGHPGAETGSSAGAVSGMETEHAPHDT